VEFLAQAGFQAAHLSTLGAANAPDPDLMAYAKAHDYFILTHNLDFVAILAATGGDAPSVVQIRADDLSPAVMGTQIISALRQSADEMLAGALVTIDPRRARITMLPIGKANDRLRHSGLR